MTEIEASARQHALSLLRNRDEGLFALLDCARSQAISGLLEEGGCDCATLYSGAMAERMAEYVPYLVALAPSAPLLLQLVEHGWGESWGYYFFSSHALHELLRHFREFVTIKLPDGKPVLFRFYDPRVLRAYLPTCIPEEIERFFGPVDRFYVESEDGLSLLSFARTPLPLAGRRSPDTPLQRDVHPLVRGMGVEPE